MKRAFQVAAWGCALIAVVGAAESGAQPMQKPAAAMASTLVPRARLDALAMALQTDPTPEPVAAAPRAASMKRALLSALVPGLGEYATGHRTRGLAFALLEGAVWVSYATFKYQEDLRGERAIEFAVADAGANAAGDDDYFSAVARFLRNDGPGQWNELVRRRARDGELIGVEYFGADSWAWPSFADFERYRSLRRRQLEAGDNATDMFALAIVNRVLSVVDAVQAVRADQKTQREAQFGLKLQLGRHPGEPLAQLGVQRRF